MSTPVELNHSPEKVSEVQAPKAESKARGESVEGLESRNADYFDNMNTPPGGGKGDNFLAMSKAEDLEGEKQMVGKSGKGGDWPVINERPSPDVVHQTDRYSCVSACGEMLSKGELKQAALIEKLKAPCDTRDLVDVLGPPWKGESVTEASLDALLHRETPWVAELRELQPANQYRRLEPAHTVVVDGLNEQGNIMIRDPADGTKYEMTRENFLLHWNLMAVYR